MYLKIRVVFQANLLIHQPQKVDPFGVNQMITVYLSQSRSAEPIKRIKRVQENAAKVKLRKDTSLSLKNKGIESPS